MKKNYQAILVMPNGKTEHVNPKNGTDFSLEELQGFVDGYVQIINMQNGERMVVNEEGKIRNLPINETATLFAKFKSGIMPNDYIVGTALVCHKSQIK